MSETTHQCPPADSSLMPCCGHTPFEVPTTDRMTCDDELVTCTGCQQCIRNLAAVLATT